MRIKENIIIIAMIWIGLIALSFCWNYVKASESLEQTALQGARSFFQQIVITRQWNARHGGLYAPITKETLPNQYLDVPLQNIEVNSSLKLTKINPAFMTRQIAEIAMEQEGIQFHITSLTPIRPENAPTTRERAALEQFREGTDEVGYFIKDSTATNYFYMAPLTTEKSCLPCHAKQGYQEGDIRGGISVTLPFTLILPLTPLVTGHLLIALFGLIGITFAGRRLHRDYETIRSHAVIDALTGIPNRRSFSESILREFNRSRRAEEPLSVIMCDIDYFKAYNDTYGHSSGDICLKKVARCIENTLLRPGDFCGRYGGEEFVVILSNTPREGAVYVAEKIRSNVEELAITHKESLPLKLVTISLGVATSEDTTLISHEDLIRLADTALYKAKNKGRNRVEAFTEI